MGMKRPALVLLLLVVTASWAAPLAARWPFTLGGEEPPTLAPLLQEVTPGVVNIATRGRVRLEQNPLFNDPFFRRFFEDPTFRRFFELPEQQPLERETQSVGSGVIVNAARGVVLTNHHVIANADEILVTLKDGRQLKGRVLGSDPETDIAVLKVPAERLKAVPLGDSDRLQVGDFVIAIGNPFGLGQTVTLGIVSALGRTGLGIKGYEDFIQTDASINPGNSGGALIDLRGELIGINTAILGPTGGNIGIGFAIPVNMARLVMEQITAYGEVRRGELGIKVQNLTPQLAQGLRLDVSEGALVAEVAEGSAAERAGLQVGDVIVALDGAPLSGVMALRNRIGLLRIGETVRLTVIRKGQTLELEARLQERPEKG
jgi:serine protease Do/serine protease DegQ